MNSKDTSWTKKELQTYILLLCANADSNETEEELNLIKSKTDPETFEKIHKEFSNDSEEERFEKIDINVQLHDYSNMELSEFRKEMYEIFLADKKYMLMERNLDRILDNILY
ncbi:hypothetical protein [Xanthomarina spongicola]|jgi:hypothetical protein|uniref:Tellurite resistance protein TerB n=1 Tax=Xanthomarina spongicola TaxID=570520 RepID=A0A316DHW5_9FLAO|nr:hypothetical protein [Xanthomarina spongicola]PWK17761.1 hypothetical protein LX78_02552 [Xanthomarina spongicola]